MGLWLKEETIMPEQGWEKADGGGQGRNWDEGKGFEPEKHPNEPKSLLPCRRLADQPLGERAKRSVQNVIGSVSSMAGRWLGIWADDSRIGFVVPVPQSVML